MSKLQNLRLPNVRFNLIVLRVLDSKTAIANAISNALISSLFASVMMHALRA